MSEFKDIILEDDKMKFINARTCYDAPLEGVRELVEKQTFMTIGQQKFFLQLMKENRPKKIIEIGSHKGGTTAIILSAMEKLELNADLHSIDLFDFENKMIETVENSLTVVNPNWNRDNWHIYCGQTIAGVAEEIGNNIDFCILDAGHILPSELLSFICSLPFMKNDAIVVLHDTRLARRGVLRGCIGTNIIFSTVVSEEKFLPVNDDGVVMNIAAFRVGEITRTYIDDLFHALTLPWGCFIDDTIFEQHAAIVKKYFNEHYDFFLSCSEFGKNSGTAPTVNCDFDKIKQLLSKNNVLTQTIKKIAFWGCGTNLKEFLLDHTPCYIEPLTEKS